ncbi:hypothetical protein P43SY_006119 [Pythium insidiosum]|uniref:Palmitoyltransferase n=1 Tax=Pythium insidiosum TaxID=114742 RepID=A0AAD5QAE7_PYTIN|nr:hypothetical protein P43SY_006119 [Pythium insidiosum]
MPPPLPTTTRMKRATQRRWHARLWWIAFHVYDYALLSYAGAIGLEQQTARDLAVVVVVAVVNALAYLALQTSAPGYLPRANEVESDLERGVNDKPRGSSPGDASTVATDAPMSPPASDGDRLMPRCDRGDGSDDELRAHFCEECEIMQPLRTKHCCDCAGVCIGERNRRLFLFYLFTQNVESFVMISIAASAFTLQSTLDEWLGVNAPFIIAWLSVFSSLLLGIPLLCYQLFLITTNQTSWEHSRRHAITYLRHLPDDKSPFDRGCVRNWWSFVLGRDANRWVHAGKLPALDDDDSIISSSDVASSSMTTDVAPALPSLLQASLAVGGATLAIGISLFLRWFCAPVVDARRLALEGDAPQELTFEDPNASSPEKKLLRFGSLADTPTCSLSVILPAFDEEQRILQTLRDTVAFFDERKRTQAGFTFEIIVVDDCSRDRTVEVVMNEIKKVSVDRLKLLRLKKNHGKGGAIRKAVMRASGERILFADADNATDIRDYVKLEQAMAAADREGVVVCGSRAHLEEEAIATRHPLRNFLMHGFHFIVSTLCVKSVRDTQCGFKLFDRTAARLVFTPMHIERWAFDVELLFIAASRKLEIKEVAVAWHEVPGSKLSVISATLTMLRELVLIRVCYMLGIWSVDDGAFRLRQGQPAK